MGEVTPRTYQPPLRGAVLGTIGLGRGAVSVELVAQQAQVAIDRARAYLSILEARRAITETPLGWVRGPEWPSWAAMRARSRPHACTLRTTSDEMIAMRRALSINVRTEVERRGWSLRELSRRSGVHHQYVLQLARRAVPPPACHLVVIARTLGTTVEDLARLPA